MKTLTLAVILILASSAVSAVTVSDVTVAQDKDRTVRVTYSLSAPAVVTVDFTTNGVSLLGGTGAPTGDVGRVGSAGAKTIVWKPRKVLPKDIRIANVKATVKAYAPARLPDYMVVDPLDGTRQFYDKVEDLPGGLLDNPVYRATNIVMRRIAVAYREIRLGRPCEKWTNISGASPERQRRHAVMMTNDYYISVFPVTRGQLARNRGWKNASDDPFSLDPFKTDPRWRMHPAEGLDYCGLRGSTNDGVNWPETGSKVAETNDGVETILHCLRRKTGILFDLPTDAQWEIAARAGNEGEFYPMPFAAESGPSATNSVKRMGWCAINWNEDPLKPEGATQKNFTHVVGQLDPNAYGLYDMYGNVRSYCRDWWKADLGALENNYFEPAGPTQAKSEITGNLPRCVSHGAQYNESLGGMTMGHRSPEGRSTKANYLGFRLVCPAYAGGLF